MTKLRLAGADVPEYDALWWRTNVRGAHPATIEGIDMALQEVQTWDQEMKDANATVLRHSLMAAGLSAAQAVVVGRDRLKGLHKIMVAGGTGHATPVIEEVFLKVVYILLDKAGADNDQTQALSTDGPPVQGEGDS